MHRKLIAAAILSLAVLGCFSTPIMQPYVPNPDQAGLPRFAWQKNWLGGAQGNGSCVVAATISALRFQNCEREADILRANYGGGMSLDQMARILTAHHVPFSLDSGTELLSWATQSRRIAIVGVVCGGEMVPYAHLGNHAIAILHFDRYQVGFYDSNEPTQKIQWVSTRAFLSEWHGWALVPASVPTPPTPI